MATIDQIMSSEAHTGRDRLALITETIAAHRKRDSDRVVFKTDTARVEYADRTITLDVSDGAQDRLNDVLASFPVFKIEQPATRKAPTGTVHVAAIADPKHIADFIERIFREVYQHGPGYELRA
ncbi:hypothetical protein [Halocatena pleomorpha]|uniref:DUF7975 domain-containing protein n=1 Tax=Halocatena pleomorpha TaxID=1785090 RepID=A0A3P3RBQ0_9EURY|nr:hypothetical protein [Halocatena pleomorpha]RRJ30378.1 hypothetical protein EIK79_10695 [Halocatena pleomorpha]